MSVHLFVYPEISEWISRPRVERAAEVLRLWAKREEGGPVYEINGHASEWQFKS